MRMLDPAAMGRFRVMVFGRGWPEEPDAAAEPLRILSFRQPERPRRPLTRRTPRLVQTD